MILSVSFGRHHPQGQSLRQIFGSYHS